MQAVCPQPRMRESRNPRRTIGRASEPSKPRCGFPPAGMHPGGLQRESGSGGPLQTACVQYARMRTASGGMIYPYIGTTKQHRCRYVPFDHSGSCAVSSSRDSHHAHSVCIMACLKPAPSCIAERVPSLDRRKPAYTHASGADFCLSGTGCHGKGIPPVMRHLLPRIWPRGRDVPSQGGGAFPHSFPAYRNPAGSASSATCCQSPSAFPAGRAALPEGDVEAHAVPAALFQAWREDVISFPVHPTCFIKRRRPLMEDGPPFFPLVLSARFPPGCVPRNFMPRSGIWRPHAGNGCRPGAGPGLYPA